MNIEDKLKELREKYKTATLSDREILIRRARALQIAQGKESIIKR